MVARLEGWERVPDMLPQRFLQAGGRYASEWGSLMPIIKHLRIEGLGVIVWCIMPDGDVGTAFYAYRLNGTRGGEA